MTPTREMPKAYTSLDEDHSAALLTNWIEARDPFAFIRYGDGYLEAMAGKRGMTCDREGYTENLGKAVRRAWDTFNLEIPTLFVGDWLASSFSGPDDPSIYEEQFRELVGPWASSISFLHPECLLLHRESQALLDFYRAVRNDPRKKVYLGPGENYPAAKMLGATFIGTPMRVDLLNHVPRMVQDLEETSFDVLLWGAGMAGTVAVSALAKRFPDRTYINLGSALDPLFRGRSRKGQLLPERARGFFAEFLK